MPATEAQIRANQANSLKSQGPTSISGKEKSRANSLKHGLTGAGIVLPEGDAAEVARKSAVYAKELNASSEVGRDLAHRAALLVVRMDRCVDQQTAALSERVRQAEADFEAPEGLDEAEIARLRAEAGRRAMFDPSTEATLARKYEASAERAFFRCLKELQQLEKVAKARTPVVDEETFTKTLASFFQLQTRVDAFESRNPEPAPIPPSKPSDRRDLSFLTPLDGVSHVPIAIGRPR